MMENRERQEEQEQKLKAARWLARLTEVFAVDSDGTHRVLEGDEAVDAIVRQWEAEGAG
jgi:hypothetical protein